MENINRLIYAATPANRYGRFFTERDRVGSPSVIVIDERLAKRLFPSEDPVGKELSFQFVGRSRIIGAVGAIKHQTLDESAARLPNPPSTLHSSSCPTLSCN
jgi:hypothetical protein